MKNLIFISVLLCSVAGHAQDKNAKRPLDLPTIWSGKFNERSLDLHMSNTENKIAFIMADPATNWAGICRLDFGTGKMVDTIFSNQTKPNGDSAPVTFTFFNDFAFSPDDKNILLRTDITPVYTFSEKSVDYVWNIAKRTLKPVSGDGKQLYATFSPDGKMLAYIRDGNLYIKQLEEDRTISVTYDGAFGEVVYGMGDLLYENGFGITKAFEWSPDSKRIAFLRLNETFVKKFPITSFSRNYPLVQDQRYPLPGEVPPEPHLCVYEIANKIFTKTEIGSNPNQYIVGFKWNPQGDFVYVQQLNRKQNILNLLKADVRKETVVKMYSDTSNTYVDVAVNNIFPVAGRKSILWLTERNGYRHIYELKEDSNTLRPITKGQWEVLEIKAVNEETEEIFYTSNEPSSREKHLYKINFDGTGRKRLTDQEGWHNTLLTKDQKFFIDEYSSVNLPTTYRMYTAEGKPLYKKLIYNINLLDTMSRYRIPTVDFYSPRINDSTQLNAYVIRPTNTGNQKLPLIIYVYGGNSKMEVTNQWTDKQTLTMRYLASLGYYVACVDPRGTPGQGSRFRTAGFHMPGEKEMEDILFFKKYLVNTLRLNIDTNKTAIMGWSYGGFLAALAQTKYAGEFKAAVAIAPVTNWYLYDNVYTERLLGPPADNAESYKKYSPINFVDNYTGGLFIVHGTSDDIVHLNNSLEMSEQMTRKGKSFEQHFYTDRSHGLLDNSLENMTRVDLYRRIEKFLRDRFGQ